MIDTKFPSFKALNCLGDNFDSMWEFWRNNTLWSPFPSFSMPHSSYYECNLLWSGKV